MEEAAPDDRLHVFNSPVQWSAWGTWLMQKGRDSGRALLRVGCRITRSTLGPRRPRCHRHCALRPEALRPHLSMGLPLIDSALFTLL